ncbi:hypothetical protein RZS08_47720, partial [Arthrospira platensis SPKY1]|nr:hypothetical protein [Arthrospira platensis SPKY1]
MGPEEAGEDVALLALGDADAMVNERGMEAIAFDAHPAFDGLARPGIFDGVGQQVEENVFEHLLIQEDVQLGIDLRKVELLAFLEQAAQFFGQLVAEACQVEFYGLRFYFAFFEAAQREEIVEDAG